MTARTRMLLPFYRQGTFPRWAKSGKNDLFRPSDRRLESDGSVVWDMQKTPSPCSDHLEMSGFYASAILSYGKTARGKLRIRRHLVVPNLRMQPNVTQSSFKMNFGSLPAELKIDGKAYTEIPRASAIKGTLSVISDMGPIQITRIFSPAVHAPALLEKVILKNTASAPCTASVREVRKIKKFPQAVCAEQAIRAVGALCFGEAFTEKSDEKAKTFTLNAGESTEFCAVYYAVSVSDSFSVNVAKEFAARQSFVARMFSDLRLETLSPILNAQFAHCVLRGSESIFKTKGGLMHAPGGGNYYAALWTNDQCEYANPFFPFSGYETGIEQSLNCYRLYTKYMDVSETPMAEKKAPVTSIIAGGDGYWNGAGDRGDAEMYAYGLSRFLLALGDKNYMREFFPWITWTLKFALSRKTADGVIASDSDELENRFPSGDANLFTSCLTYDALQNGAVLAEILGENAAAEQWRRDSAALRRAIEAYFGAQVEGYDTYRYYAGNTDLRAWICMPLSVEIFDRADATVAALFSDKLYQNGMLKTSSAHSTTWDRSLLFALRGTLLAGKTEQGTAAILEYCKNRLLGCHAPYAFEAYPEGNRAHLAAESILFARAVTEGLFGLRPVGFRQLRIQPHLGEKLPKAALHGLSLFGEHFSVSCETGKIHLQSGGKNYEIQSDSAVFDFNEMRFI